MEAISQYQKATKRATPPNATRSRKQSNNMGMPLSPYPVIGIYGTLCSIVVKG
jgi:hypothetical protein